MKRATKLPPLAGVLPSITELGRMLGVISRHEATIDLVNVGRGEPANEKQRREWLSDDRRLKTADILLFTRMDALRDLISTLPAQTLADCVVQINVASHLIMKVTCNDLAKADWD